MPTSRSQVALVVFGHLHPDPFAGQRARRKGPLAIRQSQKAGAAWH